ncbi:Glycoside hydrolase family 18 protein, partial [Rhizoctonia solani]
MKLFAGLALLAATATQVAAHYRFTSLLVNGANTGTYVNVRQNTNYNSPVTDVSSTDFTCNAGGRSAGSTSTATVPAGSTIGFALDQAIYHAGVINVYMAKAPSTAASFDGSGNVWFKVYQLSAVTNGGSTITFPADNLTQVTFKIPSTLPAGEYLVRIEHIALHASSSYPGAQFYISCAQVKVTGGGSRTPSPLVAFPGYYSGQEPGIKINIYYPIPTTYIQPGPAVWSG